MIRAFVLALVLVACSSSKAEPRTESARIQKQIDEVDAKIQATTLDVQKATAPGAVYDGNAKLNALRSVRAGLLAQLAKAGKS